MSQLCKVVQMSKKHCIYKYKVYYSQEIGLQKHCENLQLLCTTYE